MNFWKNDVLNVVHIAVLWCQMMSLVNKSANWPPNYHKIVIPHQYLKKGYMQPEYMNWLTVTSQQNQKKKKLGISLNSIGLAISLNIRSLQMDNSCGRKCMAHAIPNGCYTVHMVTYEISEWFVIVWYPDQIGLSALKVRDIFSNRSNDDSLLTLNVDLGYPNVTHFCRNGIFDWIEF